MDVNPSLARAITKPTFIRGFERFEIAQEFEHTPIPWNESYLNPKNRINSLSAGGPCGWRIDGATALGTCFYALPSALLPDLLPLRVYVDLPDHTKIPAELRDVLQSNFMACMRHSRLGDLGLCRHICRALEAYCAHNPSFLADYQELPFGSRIIIDRIAADVNIMTFDIRKAHQLEQKLFSVRDLVKSILKKSSNLPHAVPEAVDLSSLRLVRHINDAVSLVTSKDTALSGEYIFKHVIDDPAFLYHELFHLLSMKSHPNILPPPVRLVSKRSKWGGKDGVVGFLLHYLPRGCIRDELPRPDLQFDTRVRWARQIAAALLHVHSTSSNEAGMRFFYSDLRPDNVLLQSQPESTNLRAVLCDFEQRGNWYEWCAPEVRYAMYARTILQPAPPPESGEVNDSDQWHKDDSLLGNFMLAHEHSSQSKILGPHGANAPWFSLSEDGREKATVYSLGLMLYCIFEHTCNPCVSLVNAWPVEPRVQFPMFDKTPLPLQTLIRACTVDAPEWLELNGSPSRRRLQRVDSLICLEGHGLEVGSNELVHAAVDWWEYEVEKATNYLIGEDYINKQAGAKRPTLHEVHKALTELEHHSDNLQP